MLELLFPDRFHIFCIVLQRVFCDHPKKIDKQSFVCCEIELNGKLQFRVHVSIHQGHFHLFSLSLLPFRQSKYVTNR